MFLRKFSHFTFLICGVLKFTHRMICADGALGSYSARDHDQLLVLPTILSRTWYELIPGLLPASINRATTTINLGFNPHKFSDPNHYASIRANNPILINLLHTKTACLRYAKTLHSGLRILNSILGTERARRC